MPRRRYLILLAAITATVCLGATYSWSVFVPVIRTLTGISQSRAQLPFMTFYVTFPATLVFAGQMLARLGPRKMMLLGGVTFGCGWMTASLGHDHFGLVMAGIGVLGGIGVGMAYIVPIATSVLWFPRHKGLITGVAVAGFGGGAMLIARISGRLMEGSAHWTPFDIFRTLGAIFIVTLVLAGSVLANPPGFTPHVSRPGEATDVLKRRAFWMLYLAMFAGLIAGFSVNANLKQLYRGSNLNAGLAAVQIFAVANALGRIVWGFVFDRVRTATAIRLNLTLQAAVLLACGPLLKTPAGLYTFATLTGLEYGGVLVIYASATARQWGPERLGPIYSLLFSANILAAFSPVLVGRIYDLRGTFILPLMAIGAIQLVTVATVRLHDLRH